MKHPDRKERSRKRMGSGWVWPPWSARAAPPSLAHAREVQQLVQPVTCGYRLPSLARAREVQRAGQLSEIGKFSLPLPARARCNFPCYTRRRLYPARSRHVTPGSPLVVYRALRARGDRVAGRSVLGHPAASCAGGHVHVHRAVKSSL